MVGKYQIEIYNNRVHYEFEVKRSITIIQGQSATGKTTLINLVAQYERLGKGSGITLHCDRPCVVLPVSGWQEYIRNSHGNIIFIEENMPFLRSKEFADCLNYSDNYFVIVYRDSLPFLAYSIEEIYGIREDRESQKYIGTKRVYESFYKIYNLEKEAVIKPDVVITEDANSGYEFFSQIFPCKCLPGQGKSNIHRIMASHATDKNTVLGIVDGAAFGADMEKLMKSVADKRDRCCLYAPESFEYLILKSGMVDCSADEIERTFDYADTTQYESWEQYFTKKLQDLTRNTEYQYSKRKLNPAFLKDRCKNAIRKMMKGIDIGDAGI